MFTRFLNQTLDLIAQNFVAYINSDAGNELFELFVSESERVELNLEDFAYEMLLDVNSDFYQTWFGNLDETYAVENVIIPYYQENGYGMLHIPDASYSEPMMFASEICVALTHDYFNQIFEIIEELDETYNL